METRALNVTLEGRFHDASQSSTSPRHQSVLDQAATATQKLPLPQPHASLQMQPVPLLGPSSDAPGYPSLHQSGCRLTEVVGTSCSRPPGHIKGVIEEEQSQKHEHADHKRMTDILLRC